MSQTQRNSHERAYVDGHHWVSDFDFDPELQTSFAFPKPLKLFDSTLRKILYTPGVSVSTVDLLFIAGALEEIGVHEMLLNLHWWGEPAPERKESDLLRAVLNGNFGFHVCVYPEAAVTTTGSDPSLSPVRALSLVRDMGVDTVELPFRPIADGSNFDRELEHFSSIVRDAQGLGLKVVVGASDCARTKFDHVVGLANRALELDAVGFRLMDSYSSLSVDAMKLFCARLRARLRKPIELSMHVHNDFGLGTALALAAATSGVNPDVSVSSLSYRSGFASLEEVAVALAVLYGIDSGIRLEGLQNLSDIVNQRIGLPPNPFRPLTGEHAFLRDVPPAMLAFLKDGPEVFPTPSSCLAPAAVGSTMRIVWTHHHASSVIRAKLQQMRLPVTETVVNEIGSRIEARQAAMRTYPCWLTESDVEAICRDVATTR